MYIRYPAIPLIVRYLPQAIDKRHKMGRDSVGNGRFRISKSNDPTQPSPPSTDADCCILMRMVDHVQDRFPTVVRIVRVHSFIRQRYSMCVILANRYLR